MYVDFLQKNLMPRTRMRFVRERLGITALKSYPNTRFSSLISRIDWLLVLTTLPFSLMAGT